MVVGYVIVLVVLAVTFVLITGPLRAVRHARSDGGDQVAGLEAARDSKYQEIRDAEMDLRTGKLSDEDFQAIDQTLRAEAIDILRRLDAAEDAAEDAQDDSADDAAPDAETSLPSAP
jgi:type II secretory pathway component PulM